MKEILKMTLKLFVITFIAGALLGGTYFITKDPIAEQETRQATEARQQAWPRPASWEAGHRAARRAEAGHWADSGHQERRNGERRQHWQP